MKASKVRIDDQRKFEAALAGLELKESVEEESSTELTPDEELAVTKSRERRQSEILERTRRING